MLPLSQNTDSSWTSSTNCRKKIHKRLTKFCQLFFVCNFFLTFDKSLAKFFNNKVPKITNWQKFDKILPTCCQIYICVKFDKIIDNKVPISQKFHESFANVLSLVFFFCNHQFVLYRMTQKLNVWGLWCVFSVFHQNIWYIQFVAYSIFYQSSIFLYWEECWKKQVVTKYNL